MTENTWKFWRSLAPAIGAVLMFLSGCAVEEQGSLFDPGHVSQPQPVVSSIAPADSAQAGVDTLTLTGSNFSATTSDIVVYFNSTPGTVVQSSLTSISVKTPLVLGDSVLIRVAVSGSDLLSEGLLYQLDAAIEVAGSLAKLETGSGIATDATGNLYVSVQEGGIDQGIYRYAPDGSSSTFAPATAGVARWFSLKIGPSGLYAVRNVRAVYRYDAAGGAAAVLWVTLPSGVTAADIDFDQNQNLWVGGRNNFIYQVKQDKSVKQFPFVGNVHSLRVFGSYLYIAALVDTLEKIWRAPIIGDSLGTAEIYFDFASAVGSQYIPNVMTFSSDGYLYIGTSAPKEVVVVSPTGTASTPYTEYESLLNPGVRAMAWGAGDALYMTTVQVETKGGALLKLATRKSSAPYHGQ